MLASLFYIKVLASLFYIKVLASLFYIKVFNSLASTCASSPLAHYYHWAELDKKRK